jgi:UDP:flavonoid glycosyltransferase YjiC (YdhE family)
MLLADIVVASDLRFPGGTSTSIAEEVAAQADAGLRTALLHVDGPLIAGARAFHPSIRALLEAGVCDLVPRDGDVRCDLLVLRHPQVFEDPAPIARVRHEAALMVVNQAPQGEGVRLRYAAEEIDAALRAVGVRASWAPIGPLVRAGLATAAPGIDQATDDWHNIIDVDAWHVERSAPRGAVPIIGRHSRPQPGKWPDDPAVLRAAYPDDGSMDVRVLGGADAALEVLGRLPRSWRVEPFGARPPSSFLADIDFFVYYHHPHLIEAFGRTILEALASGAVAVLPPHFERLFGDAAVYAGPHEAAGAILRLHGDPAAFRRQAQRGTEVVRSRFDRASHVRRVRRLLPSPPAGDPPPGARVRPVGPPRRRVLLVSSNGAGMGHLTRLLAIATRLGPEVQPIFLTLSTAVRVVAGYGLPVEYCPSRAALGVEPGRWNRFFDVRFEEVLQRHRPDVVVFDGTWPYLGLLAARSRHPEIAFAWCRRGMWRAGTTTSQLERATPAFDLVVEPGEIAAELDAGPTPALPAHRVRPIVLVDPADALPRDAARAALGMDADAPAALVTLGAGNINDLRDPVSRVVDALASRSDRQIYVTNPAIATASPEADGRAAPLSVHPLARYLPAFDLAVSAAGYNSYHEHVAAALPTIYVPNEATRTDDQVARAAYADAAGLGVGVRDISGGALPAAIAELDDVVRNRTMREACAAVWPGNGAEEAAAAIRSLLGERAGR